MRQPRADDKPIFVNRYGVPLGASGVRFKLAQYVEAAAKITPKQPSPQDQDIDPGIGFAGGRIQRQREGLMGATASTPTAAPMGRRPPPAQR